MNFPESHPISHCKPELDQKAGILAWEERQLKRNSKPAHFAEHWRSDQPRGLKGSMDKLKQNSYELSYERMETVKLRPQKPKKAPICKGYFPQWQDTAV